MFASFFLLLAGLALAKGACPNACSGHGTCGQNSKCTCQARWVGNDCSQRECPSGLSWIVGSSNSNVPAGGSLGGHHPYAECSNRGICDRDSGECTCFEGYEGRGCRRTTCPNACSGHGFCRYNFEINSNYAGYGTNSAKRRYDAQQWDSAKTRQCVCDRGYEGIDCASRICPKGDDPLTSCNSSPGNSINDVQLIEIPASSTGWFALTFTDMYNGVYTTRPIDTTSGTLDVDVMESLEELPNFAIPNITTCKETCTGGQSCTGTATTIPATCSGTATTIPATCTGTATDTSKTCDLDAGTDGTAACPAGCTSTPASTPTCCSAYSTTGATVVRVTFIDPGNAGKQHTLSVNTAKDTSSATTLAQTTHDTADMQPRFDASTSTITVAHLSDLLKANSVATNDVLEENVECSNRGSCDGDTGLCQCFEGFTGEACQEQTVFF